MTIGVYDKGEPRRIEAVFTDALGVETDPTTVTLRVTTPAGVATAYTLAAAQVIKASTGNYYYDLTLSEIGEYYYQWEGTGPVQAIEPGQLLVKGSGF